MNMPLVLLNRRRRVAPIIDPATSVQIYTRSGDTILDRANSTIERRAV
jgi:hypothetical protein